MNEDLLRRMDAYFRAANYLSVGQIYLLANPLLREPLRLEHVKPRLLGHWGTTPGLNFIYVHANRAINEHDLDAIFVCGPGHGGPGVVANTWLEGTYSEVYPSVSRDARGMQVLFKQFSFPGGIPSHVAPETPGSIHEGGELGYSLSHAFGAAFDNPRLLVFCVVGDGEAETGPLATSWHSNKFLDAKTDGAVLPILHLNGYKIAGPTVLARIPREELEQLMRGYGWAPIFVEGDDPAEMHRKMAAALDRAIAEIARIQGDARDRGASLRRAWPMIVLRSPKGWTGPKVVDGLPVEGTFRAHQVPFDVGRDPARLAMLEGWLRSYRPEELFDEGGAPVAAITELSPRGGRRMSANPHANGGLLRKELRMPDFASYAIAVTTPGSRPGGSDARPGRLHPRRARAERRAAQLPPVQPRRDGVQPLDPGVRGDHAHFRRTDRPRRRPCLARGPRNGDAERAPVRGLARGLPAHRAPRILLLLRGVHPHRRLAVQPARQVAQGRAGHPLAAVHRVAQLPAHLPRVAPATPSPSGCAAKTCPTFAAR